MEFGEFIEALGAKVNDRSVAEILSDLLDASGYVKALEEEKKQSKLSPGRKTSRSFFPWQRSMTPETSKAAGGLPDFWRKLRL